MFFIYSLPRLLFYCFICALCRKVQVCPWQRFEPGTGSLGPHWRIYIYKENKAKSPRLHSADIYPKKQEKELQRTYRQLGELFTDCTFYVKCTQKGGLILGVLKSQVVWGSPKCKMKKWNKKIILIQKPMRYFQKKSTGQNVRK